MERAQLQPSRSAPDLTDLLEARTFDGRSTSNDDAATQAIEDEDDNDGVNHGETGRDWRRNHLPTPSPSRSPSPEVTRSLDGDYRELDRLHSATPEVYARGEYPRTYRTCDTEAEAYDHQYGGHLADSQITSESDGVPRLSGEDSLSPEPSTPTVATRPRGLSNVGTRFLPATLWDYLREELGATELDGSQEMKAERVTNFFAVPMAVEQVRPLNPSPAEHCAYTACEPNRSSSLDTLSAWTPSSTPSQSFLSASR